jgi:hypothetical protein
MAYGGKSGGAVNKDVLYVGSGSAVFLRTTAGADLEPTAALLPPGAIDVTDVRDIALDPRDWRIAYVVDSNHVFRGFTSWNKLGAGLPNAPAWDLDYDAADDVLLAGTLGRGAWTIVGIGSLTPPTSGLTSQR